MGLDRVALILERTPAVLRAMLRDLPEEWLNEPEWVGAWSGREVVCHLADLERDGWIPRIRTILDHGTAVQLRPIHRDRFRTRYASASIDAVLEEFRRLRRENVGTLRRFELTSSQLASMGRHHVFGPVTLSQLLTSWAAHDLTHLAQIARALAAPLREKVGPWRTYLPILGARG